MLETAHETETTEPGQVLRPRRSLRRYYSILMVARESGTALRPGQIHRMFTSVLFHGSILHLAFNMMAFVPMAGSLERLLGRAWLNLTISIKCTGVPVHSRRNRIPGQAASSLTVFSSCTGVPV
jgi:hypothetical protein